MKNALSYKLIEQSVSGDETAIDRIVGHVKFFL